MDFTINTGDAADSQQKNETEWVRTLAEGGSLTPGSGVDPATSGDPLCAALDTLGLIADGNAPQKYTGVQDYDDYIEGDGPVLRPRPAARPVRDLALLPEPDGRGTG